MPCIRCENGKYKIGGGKCMYNSLPKCIAALKAYYAKKNKEKK